jgi:hypothetical protein
MTDDTPDDLTRDDARKALCLQDRYRHEDLQTLAQAYHAATTLLVLLEEHGYTMAWLLAETSTDTETLTAHLRQLTKACVTVALEEFEDAVRWTLS